jgi:hypothetical protein
MNLFESLAELLNPGNERSRSRWGAICTGVIAVAACLFPFFVEVKGDGLTLERIGVTLLMEMLYLSFAYRFKWLQAWKTAGSHGGGSTRGEASSFILLLGILLLPGRLVGIGLVDFLRAFQRSESEG